MANRGFFGGNIFELLVLIFIIMLLFGGFNF